MSQAMPASGAEVLSRNHRRLDEAATRRVGEVFAERATTCSSCRSRKFAVGDALEMGSIWPDEELGTYMVALTCRSCAARTGIRLHGAQFLAG
jgi:hypothetical protein